jgi:hypothetical protein
MGPDDDGGSGHLSGAGGGGGEELASGDEEGAPVAQKVEHSVFHRGGVGSYPTRSNFSGQVTPSN